MTGDKEGSISSTGLETVLISAMVGAAMGAVSTGHLRLSTAIIIAAITIAVFVIGSSDDEELVIANQKPNLSGAYSRDGAVNYFDEIKHTLTNAIKDTEGALTYMHLSAVPRTPFNTAEIRERVEILKSIGADVEEPNKKDFYGQREMKLRSERLIQAYAGFRSELDAAVLAAEFHGVLSNVDAKWKKVAGDVGTKLEEVSSDVDWVHLHWLDCCPNSG
ncbi:hypothetical protein ACHAPO_008389 [Fusarium lateritium]